MDWLKVLALAVVQGITEFLPVSSSGHLIIGKHLMGLDSPGVRLEVVLHAGTLIAVCAYFWKRLWSLALGALKMEKAAWWMIAFLVLATLPAGVAFKLVKHHKDMLESPLVAACGLLATGVVLLSLAFKERSDRSVQSDRSDESKKLNSLRALLMGVGQAIAILPGVSRSGTTVSVARHAGLPREVAGEFAMLMSIPIILAAAAADLLGAELGSAESAVTTPMYAVGALVAAAVGYAAVGIFMRALKSGRFWMFGIYCLCAGGAALIFC